MRTGYLTRLMGLLADREWHTYHSLVADLDGLTRPEILKRICVRAGGEADVWRGSYLLVWQSTHRLNRTGRLVGCLEFGQVDGACAVRMVGGSQQRLCENCGMPFDLTHQLRRFCNRRCCLQFYCRRPSGALEGGV